MKLSISKRIIWTAIIVVLLAVTVGPISKKLQLENRVFGHFDSKATQYVEDGLERAGAAFFIARSINAVVSVFQESELQLEPAGVGVSLALGQALDPINDLIERFSWIMLASLTSLGIQKFLIEISPFVSVKIVLALALFSFLIGAWLPLAVQNNFRKIGQVLLISAIMIRFAVPAMAYTNNQVYVVFLQKQHDESIGDLNQTVSELESQQLNGLTVEPKANQEYKKPEEKTPWWSLPTMKIPPIFDSSKIMLNLKTTVEAKVEAVKSLTLKLVDTIVDLIVVFTLSTIVFPLLFLWGGSQTGTPRCRLRSWFYLSRQTGET